MEGPLRSSRHSYDEPGLRRLGLGDSRRRPIKAQLVVAIVALIVMVAVPIYLLRGPSPAPAPSASGSAAAPIASLAAVIASALPVVQEANVQALDDRITTAAPVRVRCGASLKRGLEGQACDQLPTLEQAFVAAIRSGEACAPKASLKAEGTINYVLSVDFNGRSARVFAGVSGGWRGAQARQAAQCVQKRLSLPDWGALTHQHRYYQIAVLTTYKPPRQALGVPGQPVFE